MFFKISLKQFSDKVIVEKGILNGIAKAMRKLDQICNTAPNFADQ
ncbi:MAG: hypothetical protein ACI9VI_000455 [Candidatus Azotimanducaceae bacterium]|jgi:hypothetical protein